MCLCHLLFVPLYVPVPSWVCWCAGVILFFFFFFFGPHSIFLWLSLQRLTRDGIRPAENRRWWMTRRTFARSFFPLSLSLSLSVRPLSLVSLGLFISPGLPVRKKRLVFFLSCVADAAARPREERTLFSWGTARDDGAGSRIERRPYTSLQGPVTLCHASQGLWGAGHFTSKESWCLIWIETLWAALFLLTASQGVDV